MDPASMVGLAHFLNIEIGIDPVAFEFGPITLQWYGLGYVVGLSLGIFFALRYARERGLDPDAVWDILPWALIAGFVGARFYFVIQDDFWGRLQEPSRLFAVWEGGMAFFGAVFAVIAVLLIFWRVRGYSLPLLLDVTAMFALMAQPVGRIGNMINGDILGPQADLPWSFVYTHPDTLAPALHTPYHPAALYLFISNLILIAILYPLRNRLAVGWFVGAYLTAYAISQLIIFQWRVEPEYWGLQQAQWTSLVVLAGVAIAAAVAWRRGHRPWPGGRAATA